MKSIIISLTLLCSFPFFSQAEKQNQADTIKNVHLQEKGEVLQTSPVAVEQAVKEALSRSDLEVFECDNQTEHGQVAKDCVPDGCRKPQQCQLRVITRPTFAAWLR